MATLQTNILSLKLGMQTNFTVILPSYAPGTRQASAGYDDIYPRDVRFRTLWLLGSEYGDDSELVHYTALMRYAQENNLAVVCPCVYNRLYSNDPRGQKFLDFITDELWTVCTGTFALSQKREDNLIGGVSLGAYGAVKAALRNPEKYGTLLMIGGAFDDNVTDGYLRDMNRLLIDNGSYAHYPLDDAPAADLEPMEDAKVLLASQKPLPVVTLTWAEKSPLAGYCRKAGENFRKLGFSVTEKQVDGEDSWAFRDSALAEAAARFAGNIR